MLKNKMNELSDSVDCFDKISARAFPQNDSDFSESGFVISDLENITGKSSKPRLIKWAAIAAAAVVCITVIPKTGVIRKVFSDLGGSVKKNYQQIITEINTLTEEQQYRCIDVPLDYYVKNDVLVTPLFACPFEDCDKPDAMVRIYIRQQGMGQFGGHDTAQVYAVEYTGEYSDSNIIAAAKSAYTYTEKDFDNIEYAETGYSWDKAFQTVEQLFGDNGGGYYVDNNGEAVSLASFYNVCYLKDGDSVKIVQSQVLYGHTGLDSSGDYFYDIVTCFGDEEIALDRMEMWKESVYFNGNSAFPKEEQSSFTRTELFNSEEVSTAPDRAWAYYEPFPMQVPDDNEDLTGNTLTLTDERDNALLCTVKLPANPMLYPTMQVYFSPFRFTSDKRSDDPAIIQKVTLGSEKYTERMPMSCFKISGSLHIYNNDQSINESGKCIIDSHKAEQDREDQEVLEKEIDEIQKQIEAEAQSQQQ